MISSILAFIFFYLAKETLALPTDDETLRYYQLAFGNRLTSLHYAQASEVRSAVSAHHVALQLSTSDMQFFACGSYDNTEAAGDALIKTFGKDNVASVLISRPEDTSCFLVAASTSDLSQEVMDSMNSLLNLWTPLAAEVKVSAGLASRIMSSSAGKAVDLLPIELEVTYGLGGAKTQGLLEPESINDVMTSIRNTFAAGRFQSYVHDLSTPFSSRTVPDDSRESLHMWTRASQEIADMSSQEVSTSCGFENLELSELAGDVVLVKYAGPSTTSGVSASTCLSTLTAALVHERGVIQVAQHFRDETFNKYVNSAVQSGPVSLSDPVSGHIYHQAGLTGTGVVVGLAGECRVMSFFVAYTADDILSFDMLHRLWTGRSSLLL